MFGGNTKPEGGESPNPRMDNSNLITPNSDGLNSSTLNNPMANFNSTAINHNSSHKPKPSLKLNMKSSHSSAPRSLASISGTIPNFNNSGPFSPGLFTSKRVWVKRINGTATTIIVNQNDIIDDLKSAIMSKFPNALAKYFDPADLTVKMDLHSRKQAVATNQQPNKKVNIWTQLASPEGSKSTTSPISTTFKESSAQLHHPMPQIPQQQQQPPLPPPPQQQHISQGYSYINLEPDQNVWNILDLYFPGGMTMGEAFIIETPNLMEEPDSSHISNNKYYGSNPNLTNLYNSTSPVNTQPNYHNYNRSITPNSGNLSTNGNYYQPHPQHLQNNNALYKDRSVSPSNPLNKSLPAPSGVNLHRRSQSNPPQSPISNSFLNLKNSSSNMNNNNNNNSNNNNFNNFNNSNNNSTNSGNQAVLLLPKNFSLSANAQGNANDKKRLSLDENFVSKNRDRLIQSPIGRNLTNLTNGNFDSGSESPQPFPTLLESKKEHLTQLDINGTKVDPSLESPSTPTNLMMKDNDLSISPPLELNSKENISEANKELNGKQKENNNNDNSSNNSDNNNNNKDNGNNTNDNNTNDNSTNDNNTNDNNSNNNNNNNNNESTNINKKKSEKENSVSNQVKRQTSGSKKNELKNKSATEAVLPSISVLVVEDNAINQAILGAFLRKHKIHYEIAKNGEEAIAKWRKGGFHLVLMDIQLPVKSGIEATKEIRYLERINRIGVFAENELTGPKSLGELSDKEKLDMEIFRSPVIIVALTASSNSSVDRSNALRAGCNDYLTKPVNLVWLQNKITEWGCMQALIDFDGWKTKRSNFNGTSAKILAQTTRNRSRSGSHSKSKVILGGSSQRHQKQLQT